MALRTFRSNPTLGGFGSESTSLWMPNRRSLQQKKHQNGGRENNDEDDDVSRATRTSLAEESAAFAQIIKELVDNAVDACNVASCRRSDGNTVIDGEHGGVRRSHRHCKRHKPLKKPPSENDVDNDTASSNAVTRRVRVVIDSFEEPKEDIEEGRSGEPILLRVSVSDNGCGMEDIQSCVDPFQTNKAHAAADKTTTTCGEHEIRDSHQQQQQHMTAGRYGIGLTLCLLHAQRLVPQSCAVIRSATSEQCHWTVVTCVVDASIDTIRCVRRQQKPKSFPNESGTSVSLLVPGGDSAMMAWPRIAEYFARFKLSLGISCSLEVLAPSLSRLPLRVVPPKHQYDHHDRSDQGGQLRRRTRRLQQGRSVVEGPSERTSSQVETGDVEAASTESSVGSQTGEEKEEEWKDGFDIEDFDDQLSVGGQDSKLLVDEQREGAEPTPEHAVATSAVMDLGKEEITPERVAICKAAEHYLDRSIDVRNVAHATVPIRISSSTVDRRASDGPKLEVDVIVHGPSTDDCEDIGCDDQLEVIGGDEDYRSDGNSQLRMLCSSPVMDGKCEMEGDENYGGAASLVLVRMVNRIPLLDSTEAAACGLVQGLLGMKRLWNSFGLDVHLQRRRGGRGMPAAVSLTHSSCQGRDKDVTDAAAAAAAAEDLVQLVTYEVRDSEQVAPFFLKRNHTRLRTHDNLTMNIQPDEEEEGDYDQRVATKRRCRDDLDQPPSLLLPASVRLGNMLVIIQIHAKPTTLPLPSLSKGRLPIDNGAIDKALEVGLTDCLRQLQKSNPSLLLSSAELKKVERDARYVPAVAEAVASIICNSRTHHLGPDTMEKIRNWGGLKQVTAPSSSQTGAARSDGSSRAGNDIFREDNGVESQEEIARCIEDRLRMLLLQSNEKREKKQRKSKTKRAANEPDEFKKKQKKEMEGRGPHPAGLGSPEDGDSTGEEEQGRSDQDDKSDSDNSLTSSARNRIVDDLRSLDSSDGETETKENHTDKGKEAIDDCDHMEEW